MADVTDADDNGTTAFKFCDADHDVMKTAKLSVVATAVEAIGGGRYLAPN